MPKSQWRGRLGRVGGYRGIVQSEGKMTRRAAYMMAARYGPRQGGEN